MPKVFFSRRSRRAPVTFHADDINQRPPQRSWRDLAEQKGYSYVGRDKNNPETVLLRCRKCSEIMAVHTHVLRTAQPECTPCWLKALSAEAEEAGLKFIRPDPNDSHRAIYQASCGHSLNRQRGFIQRVCRGEVSIRCDECLQGGYAELASAQGWDLLGAASSGNPSYRRFEHSCGERQDIAIANLRTGRFTCNGCAGNWASDPSMIYLFQFDLPDRQESYLKLGMSRNPDSRLWFQLGLKDTVRAQILRTIPVPSGGQALKEEKRLHGILRSKYPEWVVPSAELDWINVVSEVYRLDAGPLIQELLSDLKDRLASKK